VDLGRFFHFLIYIQSLGLLGRGIIPSQGRYLHTEQHKHRINAHTDIHTSSWIRTHERVKVVHALDCAATVIGEEGMMLINLTLH
jgi:hypothetical protein